MKDILKKLNKNHLSLLLTAIFICIGFITLCILIIIRISTTGPEVPLDIGISNPNEALVDYDYSAVGRFHEKAIGERNQTSGDSVARARIISSLGGESGTLASSSAMILGYLSSPDFFQVEIKTNNIELAKREAVDWFLSQGLSRAGICDLPLMFYLGDMPSQEFIRTRQKFSPLAPGC